SCSGDPTPASCAPHTPTPTSTATRTPTPGLHDCCQCPLPACGPPQDGQCPSVDATPCVPVFGASCLRGMGGGNWVPNPPTLTPTLTPSQTATRTTTNTPTPTPTCAKVSQPQLIVGRLNTLPGDDTLSFKGTTVFSGGFLPPLDPMTNGVRL